VLITLNNSFSVDISQKIREPGRSGEQSDTPVISCWLDNRNRGTTNDISTVLDRRAGEGMNHGKREMLLEVISKQGEALQHGKRGDNAPTTAVNSQCNQAPP